MSTDGRTDWRIQSSNSQRLSDLLKSLFGDKDLEIFLKENYPSVAELIPSGAALRHASFVAAEALLKQGLNDAEFFDCLVAARSGRKDDINEVRKYLERPSSSAEPADVPTKPSETTTFEEQELLALEASPTHRGSYTVSITLNLRRDGDKVVVGAKLASSSNEPLWGDKSVDIAPFLALTASAQSSDEAEQRRRGADLVEAIFGDASAQVQLMRTIDPRLAREEASVLTRSVNLWIESYDDALLTVPWRLLAWDGDWLEGYPQWSMSVTKLGLSRPAQVDLPRPCPIVLVVPKDAPDGDLHYRRLEKRLVEAVPSLEDGGYIRRVEVQSELQPTLRELQPAIVYFYCGGSHLGDGALALTPQLSLSELKEALAGASRTLRLVYVNACWPQRPEGDWGRPLSPFAPYIFVNPGAATTPGAHAGLRARAETVLVDVVKGTPPEVALGRFSGGTGDVESDSRPRIDRVNPVLWRRSSAWVTAAAPVEARVPFEKLKTWLDRRRQREPVYAKVSGLAEKNAPAGARILSFVFLGTTDDHPELLGDGLCAEQRARFSGRVDLIELDVEGLPMAEGFKARAEILARLQAVLGVGTEGELREALTDRRQPDRPAVFWMNWGCYPQRGRPYSDTEIAKWFSGLREVLAPHLPAGTYAVSTLGCGVEPGAHDTVRRRLRAMLRKARLNDGTHRVEVLDGLGPVDHQDLIDLLAEHARSFHAADERLRDDVANAILGDEGEIPYGRAIEQLKLVYDEGPAAVIFG